MVCFQDLILKKKGVTKVKIKLKHEVGGDKPSYEFF